MTIVELKETILDCLYRATELDDAMNGILRLVGSYFDVDRAYIFENSKDNLSCSNTYEWCNEGITPEIDHLQNVRYLEDLGGTWQMYFDEEGIFLCSSVKDLPEKQRMILEPQKITSMLQCAIRVRGEFKGYVGFDNCSGQKKGWETDQGALDTLVYTSRLIALYLLEYKKKTDQMAVNEQKMQHRLDHAEKKLRQSQEATKAKTEFLSRMSHDMRTPMNGILGLAELARSETDLNVIQQDIDKIRTTGTYLLGLINDTLDFQKIESGRMTLDPSVVYTRDLVENVLMMVRENAEKKHLNLKMKTIDANLDSYVKVDEMRMKQIFLNLLSNAVKFTSDGGSIEIEFQCIKRCGKIAHDRITISDTGIGMSEQFLQNELFKPFSQEHNEITMNYAGTGLGLSIVKKLVELMDGSIEVSSKKNVGTRISVIIDFEIAEASERKNSESQASQRKNKAISQLKGIEILMAEDNALNAEIAIRLLQKAGCHVVWVKNGQECVDTFLDSGVHQFQAILMDIRMPVMDGLETTRRIRNMRRQDAGTIPIIAMTADAYDEDVKVSIEAGMNGHLAKPINPLLMYETIAGLVFNK